ncbi:MAG: serine hydrolase domain-containing protein [Methanoregula sp.]|nr:serine hydrolase domain-containing protein [Methanoregula sp.]
MHKTFLPFVIIAGILLFGIILSTGCMQESASIPKPVDTRQNSPPPAVSADLQGIISSGIIKADVPGIQIEISSPEWTWNSAAGNASLSPGIPARPGMRFLIASVTKVFTSVAVQKLAEEGKLSLNDPIDRWLPPDVSQKIPNSLMITVRQLLDHTSGIADYDEMGIIDTELDSPDTTVPYQVSMSQGINNSPLYPPGAGYTYSNVNYILLTLIIDKAAGVPYEDYLTRNIFVPAGMNDTFIHRTNLIPGPHMECLDTIGNTSAMKDYSNIYIQFDRGAGDIVSTAADLNRFHHALRTGQLIGRQSLTAMQEPTSQSVVVSPLPDSGTVTTGYGLGYSIMSIPSYNLTLYGHLGGYPGSHTIWYYWEEKDTHISMNVNSMTKEGGVRENILNPVLVYIRKM